MTARTVCVAAVSALSVAMVIAGCTADSGGTTASSVVAPGELRLASFGSCEQALHDLRQAMLPVVGPYGIGHGLTDAGAGGVVEDAMPAERGTGPALETPAEQQHSSTNTHETGVDEPDLVKTDGSRIVTVVDGSLHVVDAASRTLTGTLALPRPHGLDEVLLSGDHALVIRRGGVLPVPDVPLRGGAGDHGHPVPEPTASELLLIDLTGSPRVLATFGIDGRFVDARMVGQTARVVTSSQPRHEFVHPTPDRGAAQALRMNREIVSTSSIDDWLPRYRLERDGSVQTGRIDCTSVTRPPRYSATSMLTVLSFDLGAPTLSTGDPVTIVADGDVVYGTAESLYVASDTSRLGWLRAGPGTAPQEQERTELYKFDTSGPGRPRHVASGAVPGSLLNQYSMSQYEGHLRVATTLGAAPDGSAGESTVYVLAQRGGELAVVGQVGGLGKGERIYAVRFVGPVGYVVTFRRTDPLYTVDLRNPSAPRVTGELKITGYSAYLHPAGDGRVIGVGQEASEQGRVQGTQVALFDVSDPATPRRIAQYHVPGGSSEAEYDPHAFLYWPPTGTLVLPITFLPGDRLGDRPGIDGGAMVLRVGEAELAEVGRLRQPAPGSIRRSLVIGDTLWTVSAFGLAAHGLATLEARGSVSLGS
jgi:uncharacterized secreted protein with C-terminal beta-propeller domain